MRILSPALVGLVAASALSAPLLAQSNTINGLDVRVYNLTDARYFGRRGPSYPNGEIGMMMGHSYCNTGTVDMTWVDEIGGQMVDTYPRIAFLVAKEVDGRMVQVSDRSFVKHSTIPYNFSSGPCAPCNRGSGEYFFRGCSDTYSSGINSNRYYLAPADEVDPWLGAWEAQGSYFDRGDPAVSGNAATDRRRSLTSTMTSAFDSVKNLTIVQEQDLVGPGNFFGQVHVNIQGESVTVRDNNYHSRPLAFSQSGGSWSISANGTSVEGPILEQWNGATTNLGGNGNDDGRFLVAVKVTGPVNGVFHYEYAIQNLDNNRGGASLRIPMDAGATVTNIGFRDIDDNPLNEWTTSRTATELSFLATPDNACDWNTIYNFWFDCDVAPGAGAVVIDQARPGPGGLQVSVLSEVPGGTPIATKSLVGQGCGNIDCDASIYEYFSSASGFDLANDSLSFVYNGGNYDVGPGTGSWIAAAGTQLSLSDDDTANVNLPFSLAYPGGSTNRLEVCSNGFVSPAGGNGTDFSPTVGEFLTGGARWCAAWHDLNPNRGGRILSDVSAARAVVTFENIESYSGGGAHTFQLQFWANGTVHVIWQSVNPSGNAYLVGWTAGTDSTDPGADDLSALSAPKTLCTGSSVSLSLDASARPVLGTSIDVITSGMPAGTIAGATLFDVSLRNPPLSLDFAGMEGCFAYISGGIPESIPTGSPSGRFSLPIPNDQALVGLSLVAQSFTFGAPLTTSGWISSNGMILNLGPN